MGMFDYLKCEVQIPGCTDCTKEEFQTKSFDNTLSNYVITHNGELYKECWNYEWIDDSTHPLFGGYMKKVENSYYREYLTDYHGDIIFYIGKEPHGIWRDYYARFTDGKLTKLWYKDTKY